MSYRETQVGDIVLCDACQRRGAVGDRFFRHAGTNNTGEPVHLCGDCNRVAVWCATHGTYHLPSTNHRQGCASCGGLFTSQVRHRETLCPACRRVQRPDAAPAPIPARPAAQRPGQSVPASLWALLRGRKL